MLKIGEFSQLAQVTIRTLHHYDKVGLLHPAHIDQFTNYRYYTVEQLPRLHRIVALKELGLSLEQVSLILDEEVPTSQIRGMLRLKQAEFQQQIKEAQRRQAMIEFRLQMLEAEDNFPELDVVIKQLEPLRVLSFFTPSPATVERAFEHREKTVATMKKAIAQGVIKHTGVTIDIFHGETILPFESPEVGDRQHEVLLGVQTSQKDVRLDGLGCLTVREEPGVQKAVTLMLTAGEQGRIKLAEKATLLRRWAIAQGYQPHGIVRFFHHRGFLQTLNRHELVFEAQLPVTVQDET